MSSQRLLFIPVRAERDRKRGCGDEGEGKFRAGSSTSIFYALTHLARKVLAKLAHILQVTTSLGMNDITVSELLHQSSNSYDCIGKSHKTALA